MKRPDYSDITGVHRYYVVVPDSKQRSTRAVQFSVEGSIVQGI